MIDVTWKVACVAGLALCVYGLGRLDGKRDALTPHVEADDEVKALVVGNVGVQTVTKVDGGSTGLYYEWASLIDVFLPANESPSILMLGLGGGEMLRVIKQTKPHAQLEAVEIDDRVITLALRDFSNNVRDVMLINADAAKYMKRCTLGYYDVVIVDVYSGPNIPDEFMQVQFFKDVEKCLGPRGMVIMNVAQRKLVSSIAASMRDAGLEDVEAFPVTSTSNVMLWAVRKDDWGEVHVPEKLEHSFERRWTP